MEIMNVLDNRGIKVTGTGESKVEVKSIDMKYGADFTVEQGFVELVQNALDARDEYELNTGIKEEVIFEYSGGSVVIANFGMSVSSSDFDVGDGQKRDDIAYCLPRGYFGTGLPKGVTTLLRNGYKVVFFSGYGLIIPKFVDVPDEKKGKVRRLALEIYDYRPDRNLTIVLIRGVSYEMYESIRGRFLDFMDDVTRYSFVVDRINTSRSIVEIIDFPRSSVWIDGLREGDSDLSPWYHRGILVTSNRSIFGYNFCRRSVMEQESRNSFTRIWQCDWDIADAWGRVKDVQLIEKFIRYRIIGGENSFSEDALATYAYLINDKEAWVQAWKNYLVSIGENPEKGVTNNAMLALRYPKKLVYVPDKLYTILRECGVPSETEAGVSDVNVEPARLDDVELSVYYTACDIASLIVHKASRLRDVSSIRVVDPWWVREKLREVVGKGRVYEKAVVIDKAGRTEDKSNAYAFVWEEKIDKLYFNRSTFDKFGVDRRGAAYVAAILLHELGHTDDVGSSFDWGGFSDGDMDWYNIHLIAASIYMQFDMWYDDAKDRFGGIVDEYWKKVL